MRRSRKSWAGAPQSASNNGPYNWRGGYRPFALLTQLFTISFDLRSQEGLPLTLGTKTIWNSQTTIQAPRHECTGEWKAALRT